MRCFVQLAAAALALLLAGVLPASAASITGYGYAQITAEDTPGDGDPQHLAADRVRLGFNARAAAAFAGAQIDLNTNHPSNEPTGTLANWIKDAFVGYRLHDAAVFKVGQFKTPVGMDFNTSGKKLDITKRGLEKPLVLERDLGVMVSGRRIAGVLGYDVGVFNPAGRSGAVFGGDDDPFGQEGDDLAYAARVLLDPNAALHFEASYGESRNAGGSKASRNYQVFDVAAAGRVGAVGVKAEYIHGNHVRGAAGREEGVYCVQTDYQLTSEFQALVRHYGGRSEAGGRTTHLRNTYLGVNWFPFHSRTNGRVQINYVFAGGDRKGWNGVGGFRSDAVLLQWQLAFDGTLSSAS